MAEIFGIDKLLSFVPRKKFGRFCEFGIIHPGQTQFGDTDIYIPKFEFGSLILGSAKFGDIMILSGIYRTDNVSGYTRYYREPYYITKNPETIPQQATRSNFADAIDGWHNLTPEQKAVYNKRACYKNFSGYNLFIKEYLLSH